MRKISVNDTSIQKTKEQPRNILVKSSNIGSIRIVKTGLVSHQKFLKEIGLLDKSEIEISKNQSK